MFRGAIFDLDGVIVDTAKYHYLAWKRLAAELGFEFAEEQNEALKGVSRMRSLEILLAAGGLSFDEMARQELATKKNGWYVEYINKIDRSEILPGALELLAALKNRGVRIALGTASKNSVILLGNLKIEEYFDAIVDGNKVSKAKPDPEVFVTAARGLGLRPWECVVFEDAEAGIEAARRAGMYAVGVGNSKTRDLSDQFVTGLDAFDAGPFFVDRLWCLSEEQFDPGKNRHYEGAFTTGNGYLSVRGSLEEGLGDDPQDEEYLRMPTNVTLEKFRSGKSKWGTFIPGIVGNHPLLNQEMINLPWFIDIGVWFDGEKLDMEKSNLRNYCRYLNMKEGTLHRSFEWLTANGSEAGVSFERFISMDQNSLSVQRLKVVVLKGGGILKLESGINPGVRTNGYNHFQNVTTGALPEGFIFTEVETDVGNHVFEVSAINSLEEISFEIKLDSSRIFFSGGRELAAGEALDIVKLTCITTDRDLEMGYYRDRALQVLKTVNSLNYDQLYQNHFKILKQKWEYSDVKIKGDDTAQLALRFSIYHLIRSNVQNDPRVAVCAKGHAGEAYFGRYFWDNEIYLLPFFIYTNPVAARNLVLFRYHTLEGARRNAGQYGYHGARYPWESSSNGVEQCACWQYADHEIHITADVIYALWHYYRQTDDLEFMEEYGLEMLVETARYWVERVDRSKDGAGYGLAGVMGPDEYVPFSRNNAYTNRMVKFSLEKTIEMLELIESKNPQAYRRLVQKINFTPGEVEVFRQVMENLPVPYDEGRQLVLQSEDFEWLADLDFNQIWTDRTKPFGHFISQEKNYRSKALKQADVLMLMALLPGEFSGEQLKKAYDYYEPITTHDSSLSTSAHAMIAAWLGKMGEAESYFLKSVQLDLDPGRLGCEEGIHIANAGGIWQAVVHGFAGIKNVVQSETLTINPNLPKSWEQLEFTIMWKRNRVKIMIEKGKVSVTNLGSFDLKAP
jgi:kojibiose phosphorylase